MRYRELGGKRVSVLALGTGDFGGKIAEEKGREFLDAWAELGGNYVDTARVYGDFEARVPGGSERVVGRWLEGRERERFFISTKGGHPDLDRMDVSRLSRGEILDDARRSLDALRTDCVDIYWLHRDDVTRPVGELVETLNALLDAGMTRMIGASNWSPRRVREANAWAAEHGLHPLDANQPQCSLARQTVVEDPTLYAMDGETWRLHRETGMPLMPFSAQAKGFFTKLYELGEAGLPEGTRRDFMCPENMAVYRRLLALREQTGLSVGALSLAWLTCQPFPVFPQCGASRLEHVLALGEAGDAVITPEQRDYLRAGA